MKHLFFVLIYIVSITAYSKEWKSLQHYQTTTNQISLTEKDWLCSDRKQNTIVWQQANLYNLQNNFPEEYLSIQQRRDFYKWYYTSIENKGHEVVWPKMAYFISNKLRLIKAFPYHIFTKKSIKEYAYQGSKIVFNSAFLEMKTLYYSRDILKGEEALQWDTHIIEKEQKEWLPTIYQNIDAKSLKTIERMAKGKGFYSLMLAKEIVFQGDVSSPSDRYEYALNSLRNYCEKKL